MWISHISGLWHRFFANLRSQDCKIFAKTVFSEDDVGNGEFCETLHHLGLGGPSGINTNAGLRREVAFKKIEKCQERRAMRLSIIAFAGHFLRDGQLELTAQGCTYFEERAGPSLQNTVTKRSVCSRDRMTHNRKAAMPRSLAFPLAHGLLTKSRHQSRVVLTIHGR